jgi:tRNA (cytidine/uridine-2'-O-)-methyltransferase
MQPPPVTDADTAAQPPLGEPAPPPLHVVLVAPQIPQNTGNIGRMCAITGSRLHLIEPLGYSLDDRYLRRAGMDYWRVLDVHVHKTWDDFSRSPLGPKRLWLFTTHASRSFWDVTYAHGDGLVFGSEGAGAPDWLHQQLGAGQRLKIDQPTQALRSLNLATSAGVATYEALRCLRAAGRQKMG